MYSFPDNNAPIRQGDIFRWLPKVNILLGDAQLPIMTKSDTDGIHAIDWFQLAESGGTALTNTIIKPTIGIVLTQDCDASRCLNIVFSEVDLFSKIYSGYKDDLKPAKVVNIVTVHSRKNQKWYFLAENSRIGFSKKMGANFESVFEVPRTMLETYRDKMRLGRLDDDVAWPHFRERVAEFFRRYPYNEWYPLNLDEVKAYEEEKKTRVERYPWHSE